MKEKIIVSDSTYPDHHHRCISWSAIFGGTFVGLGLGFLLHLYSIAISLSAFSSSSQGAEVIAIGGFVGMLIAVIASMVAAGYVSGYLGRHHHHSSHTGIIYGFITWTLILLVTALTAGPLMTYTASYKSSLTRSANANIAVVKVTPDADAPTVKQTKNNETVAVVSPTQLAWGGWIVFALFFVGAVSCCVGASCGLQCCKRSQE